VLPLDKYVAGLAVSADGALLYAASRNQVFEVETAGGGVVRTLAGGFRNARGVALSNNDRLYVTDELANRVFDIDIASGRVSAPAWNAVAGFNAPWGVVAGRNGELFVSGLHGVHRVGPEGGVTVVLPPETTELGNNPTQIALNGDHLYAVIFPRVFVVQLYTPGRAYVPALLRLGFAQGGEDNLTLRRPWGLAVDGAVLANQTLYVTEPNSARVRTVPTWTLSEMTGVEPTSSLLSWTWW